MHKNLFYRLILLIFVFFLVNFIIISDISFLKKQELSFNDNKFRVRKMLDVKPKINEKIVIVAVDEKSINKIGRWPWDRKIIGDLFKKLKVASLTALDIVFSEYSNPDSDGYLSQAIEENGNIVGGFFFRSEATEVTEESHLDIVSDSALLRFEMLDNYTGIKEFPYVELNIPEISEALLASAFFTIEPDFDGLYRQYPFFYIYKGLIFPSLGLQTLRYYKNRDFDVTFDKKGINKLKMDNLIIKNSQSLRLNFYDEITYLSAYDVLYNGADKLLKDKIVFVGITETGIFDLRPTPIDPVTPGVSLHATFVSNVLNNDFINEHKKYDLSFIIAISLFIFLIGFMKKIYYRSISYLFLIVFTYSISIFLFAKQNIWINDFYYFFMFLSLIIFSELLSFITVDIKAMGIKKAFSSYVSPEVVEIMTQTPDRLKLGGESREISVIFTDIRGFTTLSENLDSEKVVYILNRLNTPLTHTILEHKGLLDKYIGDAIMAIFNAPVNIENHPDMACKSALQMLDIIKDLNSQFKNENLPEVAIGVGINTGIATVGNIGSDVRFDYTAIGDTVNLASRLEGLNKVYKTGVILSEFTANKLKEDYCLRLLDKVIVKGKDRPVKIYELLKSEDRNIELSRAFHSGLTKYFEKDFKNAKTEFESIYEKFEDETSRVFIQRCEYLILNPPPENWDGSYIAETK